MNIFTLSVVIDHLIEAFKHFHVKFNDSYVTTMCKDGTWKDLSYEQFKILYITSFIETMLSCDE